ncbi:YqzM family protein [Paenibacillus faecalis]|uniref:YqzM family protein n=1 Tax=Paenibacillus faecalis TaxID=2079532 RepID=UPI000D0F4EF3|nr:YqzM family protein [Paenibacillus faecalis]
MDTNVRAVDPREHINEEPRNDFSDLVVGFTGMFAFMFVIFFAMVIIKFIAG